MKIGLPKEVKNNEFRVGLTPDSVGELSLNHKVFVQKNAGKAIGFTDEMYQANGAQILENASSVFDESDLIVKVKEPLPEENQFLSSKHTLFTYLHLAGNIGLEFNTRKMVWASVTHEGFLKYGIDPGKEIMNYDTPVKEMERFVLANKLM